jgi:hypothetical protein
MAFEPFFRKSKSRPKASVVRITKWCISIRGPAMVHFRDHGSPLMLLGIRLLMDRQKKKWAIQPNCPAAHPSEKWRGERSPTSIKIECWKFIKELIPERNDLPRRGIAVPVQWDEKLKMLIADWPEFRSTERNL